MAKVTYVELDCRGRRQSFELDHAERILQMENNGGWQLPVNSKYEFDLANGIRLKQTKRETKNSEE